MFLSSLSIKVMLVSYNELGMILLLFNCLDEFVWNFYYFYLRCYVELANEDSWALKFLCGKNKKKQPFFNVLFTFKRERESTSAEGAERDGDRI